MADTKISALTSATPVATDETVIVDDPGGTPSSKRVTLASILGIAHNHSAGQINSGTLADARVAESNVTQHEAALSITESQISDLGDYATNAALTAAVAGLLGDLADDTSPTLGGDLNTGGFDIVTPTDSDLDIVPGGTGRLKYNGDEVAVIKIELNEQTGTSYTLTATDQSKLIQMNNASANTLTLPTNAAVPFGAGVSITIQQTGAGTTTIDAPSGVTLNGADGGSCDINTRWQGATLIKISGNTWTVMGDITAVA